MSAKHVHHIVPKHVYVNDSPDNLVELTVEEHAEAHRMLFDKYGRWQDRIAWLGLAGLIGKEELIRQVISNTFKGVEKTEDHKNKISSALKGKQKSEKHLKSLSESKKGVIPWVATNAAAKSNKGSKRPNISSALRGENNPNYRSGVCFIPMESRLTGFGKVTFESKSLRAKGKLGWTDGVRDVRSKKQPEGFYRGRSLYAK